VSGYIGIYALFFSLGAKSACPDIALDVELGRSAFIAHSPTKHQVRDTKYQPQDPANARVDALRLHACLREAWEQ